MDECLSADVNDSDRFLHILVHLITDSGFPDHHRSRLPDQSEIIHVLSMDTWLEIAVLRRQIIERGKWVKEEFKRSVESSLRLFPISVSILLRTGILTNLNRLNSITFLNYLQSDRVFQNLTDRLSRISDGVIPNTQLSKITERVYHKTHLEITSSPFVGVVMQYRWWDTDFNYH
ncbi:hypothetical protein [Planctobacterium marinum]|uniref:hypothetical protein n=1 Tax=Planctobacterium marinum TaxID=1631968 RepID=UPI001E5103F2|nr:hypothetical protein [Planctobacterium marinum]MCC2607930.1 hypothetical protein [Planctobacterium marinum]